MKKSQLLFAIFCLIILSNQAFSADILTTKYGFTAASLRGSFNTDEGYPNDPLLPFFVNAVGNGFSIGGAVLMPINYLSDYYLESRLRMSLSFEYYESMKSEKYGASYPSLYTSNGETYDRSFGTIYTIDKDFNRLNLELQYSVRLPEIYLVVNVGSLVYYATQNHEIRKLSINSGDPGRLDTLTSNFPIKPYIIRYEDNFRTAVYAEGTDKSIPAFGAGLIAGIGTEFKIANITFTPMISAKRQSNFASYLFSLDVLF